MNSLSEAANPSSWVRKRGGFRSGQALWAVILLISGIMVGCSGPGADSSSSNGSQAYGGRSGSDADESATNSVEPFEVFSADFSLIQAPIEAAKFPDNAIIVRGRLVSTSPQSDAILIDVDGRTTDEIEAELLEFEVLEVLRWITVHPDDPGLLVDRAAEPHRTVYVRTFGTAQDLVDASKTSPDFFLFLGVPVLGAEGVEGSAINFIYQLSGGVAYSADGEYQIRADDLSKLVREEEPRLFAELPARGFRLIASETLLDDEPSAPDD